LTRHDAVREIDRLAARLVIVAPTRRVLMLHLNPSFRDPFWVTPGGGLDDGETFEAAARRELYEEVGRSDLQLGPCIAEGDIEFTWEEWLVRQHERVYLVAAPYEFDPEVIDPGIEPIIGAAWFSADELRLLGEVVYPDGIAELVESAVLAMDVDAAE
jgi:8-oxo-dGTP diphosphatase